MAKSILSYLRVDYSSLIPDGIILTEPPKSFYEFKDGIRGEQIGIKYTGVSPNMDYKEIDVKVKGQLKPSVEYQGTPILLLAFDEKDLKKGNPILVSKKLLNNKKVILREFYTNIPLNKWNEKKEDISHVMNITIIGNIQYSKKNLIQFKSVVGKTPKESCILYDDI